MTRRVSTEVLHQVISDVLQSYAVSQQHADMVARGLVEADMLGLDTHGVAHLVTHPSYIPGLESGLIDPHPTIRVTELASALAMVDGGRGMGLIGMTVALDAAMERALQHGMAAAWVQNSYHAGALAYFVRSGAVNDLITIATTNTRPSVVPTFGLQRALGTNPISIGVPYQANRVLLLDMATSAVAAGRVEQALRENESMPLGWVVDKNGQDTPDPADYFDGGGLLPLGSTPQLSNYKGYGLAVMVDVLTGLLSGMGHSLALPIHGHSHMIMCLDVSKVRGLTEFKEAVRTMVDDLHAIAPVAGHQVLVPGEREWQNYEERIVNGIPVSSKVLQDLSALLRKRGLLSLLPQVDPAV